MSIIDLDLASLPTPQIVEELDFEAILTALLDDFKVRWPDYDVGALETDPAKMLMEVAAYRETLLRSRINEAARANLLAYATGSDLDHLAAFYDVVRLATETDDRLRQRVVLAVAGRSTGGTAERYRYHAMTADVRIKDVVAYVAPTSPVVNISVLSSLNNGVPDTAMMQAVQAALTQPTVQMVNDTFAFHEAVAATVNVTASIWLLPNAPQATFDGLEQALRDAWALEGGLGRDLTKEWLTARLMRPGVARAVVSAPAGVAVAAFYEAISLGVITLTDMGRDY